MRYNHMQRTTGTFDLTFAPYTNDRLSNSSFHPGSVLPVSKDLTYAAAHPCDSHTFFITQSSSDISFRSSTREEVPVTMRARHSQDLLGQCAIESVYLRL